MKAFIYSIYWIISYVLGYLWIWELVVAWLMTAMIIDIVTGVAKWYIVHKNFSTNKILGGIFKRWCLIVLFLWSAFIVKANWYDILDWFIDMAMGMASVAEIISAISNVNCIYWWPCQENDFVQKVLSYMYKKFEKFFNAITKDD